MEPTVETRELEDKVLQILVRVGRIDIADLTTRLDVDVGNGEKLIPVIDYLLQRGIIKETRDAGKFKEFYKEKAPLFTPYELAL